VMQRPTEVPLQVPIACPVCVDHAIEKAEGISLSASPIGGREISKVSVYRCSRSHLFALFDQPVKWE